MYHLNFILCSLPLVRVKTTVAKLATKLLDMLPRKLCARSAFFIKITIKILIYRGLQLIKKRVQVSVHNDSHYSYLYTSTNMCPAPCPPDH